MTPGVAARRVLLLCRDALWRDAVRHELDRHGRGLDLAASAQDAIQRLVEPAHPYSHLLVEPEAAGPFIRELVGVSAGETGSQVALLLLGESGDMIGGHTIPRARAPDDLPGLLGVDLSPAAEQPALSTSDIAIGFRAENLECRFQPIVRLADRQPVGIETLVRMQHPERGTLGPDQFIPQIERGGLSLRLTEAVARNAMFDVRADLLAQHDLYITINLPLDVLLFPETLGRIDAHRRVFALPAERVMIELTESRPVLDLPGLSAAIDLWSAAGYRVAIDDMGPEMVHQLELFDLPFSVIKLDKDVVLRSEHDPLARSYLQRLVDNAHAHSLSVIAEGIESEAMWRRMLGLGVEQAQGFLIGRAMPAAALPSWLAAWAAQTALPPDRVPG